MIMTDGESMRSAQVTFSCMLVRMPACCPPMYFMLPLVDLINHFPPGGLLDPCSPLPFVNFQSKTK